MLRKARHHPSPPPVGAGRAVREWNAVATVHEGSYRAARNFLAAFGDVVPSEFRNVLLVRVDDVEGFTGSLGARVAAEPGVMNLISRVVPSTRTFNFQTPAEFDERAGELAVQLAPGLAGKRFYVRMHRRGFKHRLSSHEAEQRLSKVILESLAAAGTPAAITFKDPDAVVAIETVGQRAGVSLWTRDQLRRYPFLRLD